MGNTFLLLCLCVLLICSGLPAQTQTPSTSGTLQTQSDLRLALLGTWVGTLEYRDYSDSTTSTKRVTLPTWLSISDAEPGKTLKWHYVYDDGPAKIVEETDIVRFDPANSIYEEADNGKPKQIFEVTGYDTLHSGRGTLVLTGSGTDNNKPSETRLTMKIERNLIDILEETRPAGSRESFVFRHAFRFTRAVVPRSTH